MKVFHKKFMILGDFLCKIPPPKGDFWEYLVHGCLGGAPMGMGHNFSQNVILEAISALAAARPPPPALVGRQGYPWVVETSWRSIMCVAASKN